MVTLLLLLACADGEKAVPNPVEAGDSAADTAPDTADSGDTADSVDTGPMDADGDGYFGAEDCDDADPDVYPGAPDWCDAQDQDCDGDPVGAGMCGEVGDLGAVAATEWWGPPQVVILIPTTWSTSVGDLVGGVTYRRDDDGTVRGGGQIAFSAGGEGELAEDALHRWPQDFDYALYSLVNIGDFDGDGWDDLASEGGDNGGFQVGAVYLLSGDADTWTGSEEGYLQQTSMAWWRQETSGDDFGAWVAGGGDVNDDGLADVFVHAPLEMDGGELNAGST